jgi:hypothetical protein
MAASPRELMATLPMPSCGPLATGRRASCQLMQSGPAKQLISGTKKRREDVGIAADCLSEWPLRGVAKLLILLVGAQGRPQHRYINSLRRRWDSF